MNKKREITSLAVGFAGAILGLCGVVAFNRFLIMSLPLAVRMISMIVIYWIIALPPILIAIINKDKLTTYLFEKNKIAVQMCIGLSIGIIMSLILTLIPHLCGFGEYVDNGKRYQFLWQFIYEFLYCIIAIGFVEEFLFRGFIFEKIKNITDSEIIALAISSVAFGLFHLFNGNIIQVIMTTFIGAFLALCKMKIKNCSVLSLIVAHGVYDAMITVWLFVFL